MIRAIEDGLYQPSMKARMAELEAEKAALEERLAAPELPKVLLHPNLAAMYRQKVAALEQALADPEIKAEAMEIVRSQIERITLTPNAEGGLDIQLQGDLARILQLCESGAGKSERPGTDELQGTYRRVPDLAPSSEPFRECRDCGDARRSHAFAAPTKSWFDRSAPASCEAARAGRLRRGISFRGSSW